MLVCLFTGICDLFTLVMLYVCMVYTEPMMQYNLDMDLSKMKKIAIMWHLKNIFFDFSFVMELAV
jgi:hypothetical protein